MPTMATVLSHSEMTVITTVPLPSPKANFHGTVLSLNDISEGVQLFIAQSYSIIYKEFSGALIQ